MTDYIIDKSGSHPIPVPPIPVITDVNNVVLEQPVTQYARFDLMTILNRILSLLIGVVGVLQETTGKQADRLSLLTSWQQAYTTKISEVPTFLAGTGDRTSNNPIDSGTVAGGIRDRLNQLNQNYTSNMQAYRSLVEDDAKSLQAAVNQSNDAVNQNADGVTAILQQFSTILGAIFR